MAEKDVHKIIKIIFSLILIFILKGILNMGQTPSKDAQYAELYSAYIQQQQNLIAQQQSQINSLYQMNLESQQQMPANMFFQSDVNQGGQQGYQNNSLPQLPSAKPKLDPYKILGISKNYDEKILKKAYLKKAMKAHPDRGGILKHFNKYQSHLLFYKKNSKKEKIIIVTMN